MEGWWCVRYGAALAWVEAPSGEAAVRRSLDLHPFGDWTDDARRLVVFPVNAYPLNSGPHDYTRAVLNADLPSLRALPSRRTPRARTRASHRVSRAAACVASAPVTGASGSSRSLAFVRASRAAERA